MKPEPINEGMKRLDIYGRRNGLLIIWLRSEARGFVILQFPGTILLPVVCN